MDHVSARDANRLGAHSRRWRMRERARSQHAGPRTTAPEPALTPVPSRFRTPEWLDHSFVLPLTQPEGVDVPSQPVGSHDDDRARSSPMTPETAPGTTSRTTSDLEDVGGPAASAPLAFVRPATDDVDFARVVRRSDLCRSVTRLHWLATGLAGVALLLYLLLASPAALVAVVVLAVVAVGAFAVRVRLSRAPVPRVQR